MTEFIELERLTGNGGAIGQIWLNRPRALNACNTEMCVAMRNQLEQWAKDISIKAVVIRSRHDRAFCAGGDIRAAYDAVRRKEFDLPEEFFKVEYALNLDIAEFPKPYVALMDGMTLGGGVGISIHGSHRVMTERAIWAMPETAIGFFPDVGASYFLNRTPGEIGTYLALTGARIHVADALYAKLGDFFISSHRLDKVVSVLLETPLPGNGREAVSKVLQEFAIAPSSAPLAEQRTIIDRAFRYDTIEDIQDMLKHIEQTAFVQATTALLNRRSPNSLRVTLHLLRTGRDLSLRECLARDLDMAKKMIRASDFLTGVRAVVVDKDQEPAWEKA